MQGLLSTIYARGFIAAAQRHSEVPRLTPAQIAAMDLVDELAASDLLRMDYDLQPGDLQLLHNHPILHARSAFEDFRAGHCFEATLLQRCWGLLAAAAHSHHLCTKSTF